MTFVPFSRADQCATEFLALLAKMGIHPLNRGRIEGQFLTVTELLDIWKSGIVIPGCEDVIRTAAGIHDFAAKVLAAQNLPEFKDFRGHLELIATGELETTLSQMTLGAHEDASRKLVELYIALLAIHVGTNVALDHPNCSKGDNPDVMFDWNGHRWAIAIKATTTMQGQTLYEHMTKAASQIEASKADRGFVLLSVTNGLDHRALWNAPFSTTKDACAALRDQISRFVNAAELNRPVLEWADLFSGKTASPVLFMGQSVVQLPTMVSDQTATPIKMLLTSEFGHAMDVEAEALAYDLNDRMQTIL